MTTTKTYLGFDYGLQRIGVAVGQSITGTSRPLVTVKCNNGAPDWDHISKLFEEWNPDALVVGVPVHMDGSEQEMTKNAKRFANRLEGRYNIKAHTVDERLSSRKAEEQIAKRRAAGIGKRSKKGDTDKIAAQIILQDWLDSTT